MSKDKNEIKEWPVTEVKADGKPGMHGGAYTHSFVYSNEGNFILKGYLREVEEHLLRLKSRGLKYFVNHTLYCNEWIGYKKPIKNFRNIWEFYRDDISIRAPYYAKGSVLNSKKWSIGPSYDSPKYKKVERIEFKRFPKCWKPFLDKLI